LIMLAIIMVKIRPRTHIVIIMSRPSAMCRYLHSSMPGRSAPNMENVITLPTIPSAQRDMNAMRMVEKKRRFFIVMEQEYTDYFLMDNAVLRLRRGAKQGVNPRLNFGKFAIKSEGCSSSAHKLVLPGKTSILRNTIRHI